MRIVLSLIALVLISPCFADENVRIYMRKGSVIYGTIASETIPIQTEFGKLEIPIAKVKSIRFGLHYESDQKKNITEAVKVLGDSDFKKREQAFSVLLRNGRHSLPFLPETSEDLEVIKRVKSLVSGINEKFREEIPLYDTITTPSMEAKGEILLEFLKITPIDSEFGTLTAKVTSIDLISIFKLLGGEYKVEADAKWHKTSTMVEKGDRFKIQASGSVDLWPQTPGQYMSSPGGSANAGAGKNSQHRPGTLIGKVGESGAEFLVGESGAVTSNNVGHLYLMIVESTWNSAASGSYKAVISSQ